MASKRQKDRGDPGGYLALVLHAHLPYVKHPEHPSFLEEAWLFEALTETYIPLLLAFRRLAQDKVPFRLTLSISPPLLSMLADRLLQQRYREHLGRLNDLLEQERRRTAGDGHLSYLGDHYRERLEETETCWASLGGNIVAAFAELEEQGYLDILTSGATHGYLPLLQVTPEAVRAQIAVAVEHHKAHLGRAPQGIWLPECGYFPGLDRELARHGLRYFVADAHGLLLARPRPRLGTSRPLFCAGSGVAVFGRDPETSAQVWSRERGYPGDPVYREFYRDIGFDLEPDQVAGWVQPDGRRTYTGIKYHRITGATDRKELYDPYWARERAEQHALDFINHRRAQVRGLAAQGPPPIILAPYDAELFGHWWYEGPWWLERTLRLAASDEEGPRLTTMGEYLSAHPTQQVSQPAQSSWGDGGYHAYWLNGKTEWLYPHLHRAAEQMVELARANLKARGLLRRGLNQAARELLLAQASDWAFILHTGTATGYAAKRTRSHLCRFHTLRQEILAGQLRREWLDRLEYVDSIFPDIDYRVYA